MNSKMLLDKISAVEFAMWELHLYLDTHPEDLESVKLYNSYKEKRDCLVDEFESKYYSLTSDNAQGVCWIKNPWPWEKEGCI